MNPLLEMNRNIGGMRLAAMTAVTVVLLIFFIFITTRLAMPSMGLLYADLEPSDSTLIAGELQRAGIPFEKLAGGSRLMVPADRVGPLRMMLAGQGLPSSDASILDVRE